MLPVAPILLLTLLAASISSQHPAQPRGVRIFLATVCVFVFAGGMARCGRSPPSGSQSTPAFVLPTPTVIPSAVAVSSPPSSSVPTPTAAFVASPSMSPPTTIVVTLIPIVAASTPIVDQV